MATINGTNANNNLNGTNLADQIFGLGGNDILIGFDGDDVLEGGKGADQLFGSSGFDTASYRNARAGVEINYNGLRWSAAATQRATSSSASRAWSAPTIRDYLYGDDHRNDLRGDGGSDQLNGWGGNDRLSGGAGSDILIGDGGADELRGDGGTDFALYYDSDQAVTVDLAAGKGFGGDARETASSAWRRCRDPTRRPHLRQRRRRPHRGRWRRHLAGGGGADRFFCAGSSPTETDRILDFSRGQGDRIVTSDAKADVEGFQLFKFIGKVTSPTWVNCAGTSRTATRSSRATPPRSRAPS